MSADPDPSRQWPGRRRPGPDSWRNAGFVACLIGAVVMVSGRFMAGAPAWLVYVGLSGILFGWGLFALSIFRRARASRAHAPETKS